jgi:hypothetical protein
MVFVLPPREKVGYLDPEIAGEGQKVILSDGDQVSWSPPPAKPVMPDMSQIKAIQRYFNRTGHAVWPAWLYHPTEEPRLVKNANEAAELGVCYRQATMDEKGRYGRDHVWDWKDDSQWRPTPHGVVKFDPKKPGTGKTYIPEAPNPVHAQNDLLAMLVPAVAAAVASSLKATGPGAPANIDPNDWDAFLKFQAWQKANQVVQEVAKAPAPDASDAHPDPAGAVLNALQEAAGEGAETDERESWLAEAERKGLKVDKRWSTERIKAEVLKAA